MYRCLDFENVHHFNIWNHIIFRSSTAKTLNTGTFWMQYPKKAYFGAMESPCNHKQESKKFGQLNNNRNLISETFWYTDTMKWSNVKLTELKAPLRLSPSKISCWLHSIVHPTLNWYFKMNTSTKEPPYKLPSDICSVEIQVSHQVSWLRPCPWEMSFRFCSSNFAGCKGRKKVLIDTAAESSSSWW